MTAVAIEITNVQQSFRTGFWMSRTPVLHDVSLSIPEGTVFGFLGANGAGKTTLIHLIAGLRKPVSGLVRIGGLQAETPEARALIGYLPERPYFHEHLTGESLLNYFGHLSGMSPARIREQTPLVLEEVGMQHAARLELRKYSKGMLQRIGIAQALLHDPKILVLDEPMSGLDPIGRKDMRELILRMQARGKTVFFSSHVIPDVEAVCTQVGLIERGRLKGCGKIEELLGGTAGDIEITFDGISPQQAARIPNLLRVATLPGGSAGSEKFRGFVSDEKESQQILKTLLSHQARILGVHPARPSLEDLFK